MVAGFGMPNKFDLSQVNFASATKSYSGNTSSGTLTVSDRTHSVSLLLLGQYARRELHPGLGRRRRHPGHRPAPHS